jgi:hypothetical protein
MPTERIKDELIRLLISEDRLNGEEGRLNIEMAMTLSVERILVENKKPPQDQKMIAALLEHVQTHDRENTNLRVIAPLLLLPKDVVIGHLLPILYAEHQEWLIHIFLLLGPEGGQVEAVLGNILQSQDPAIPHQLRREAAAVMGFLGLDVGRYATSLPRYSPLLQAQPAGPITRDFQKLQQQHEELDVALRALGGLLAGGKWNSEKLLALWSNSEEGSSTYELYSVLLGKQFSGQIKQLELAIRHMQKEYNKQIIKEHTVHDKEKVDLNNTILQQMNKIRILERERDSLRLEVTRLKQ